MKNKESKTPARKLLEELPEAIKKAQETENAIIEQEKIKREENKARWKKIRPNVDVIPEEDTKDKKISPKYEAKITKPDDDRKLPDDVKSDLLLEEQKEHENEI